MNLIIEPNDGVTPIVHAIKKAKRTIHIVIFRFDRFGGEVHKKVAHEVQRSYLDRVHPQARAPGTSPYFRLDFYYLDILHKVFITGKLQDFGRTPKAAEPATVKKGRILYEPNPIQWCYPRILFNNYRVMVDNVEFSQWHFFTC